MGNLNKGPEFDNDTEDENESKETKSINKTQNKIEKDSTKENIESPKESSRTPEERDELMASVMRKATAQSRVSNMADFKNILDAYKAGDVDVIHSLHKIAEERGISADSITEEILIELVTELLQRRL